MLEETSPRDDSMPETSPPEESSTLAMWLQPNPAANAVFDLEKRDGNTKTKAWLFFHIVKGVKENIEDANIPKKWSATAADKNQVLACCNMCGDLVVVGDRNKYGKKLHCRTTSMISHLASGKHSSTTADILYEQIQTINGNGSDKKRKVQSTLLGFAKSGTLQVPLKLRQKHQDLKTAKFIIDCNLPFQTVEEESFREMIQSHNPHAKVMSNKKVKNIVIGLESAMRATFAESMRGLAVCCTLDHWTSKAHQNYTGMTAHFIDDNWKLNNLTLGIFLHEGGTDADELEIEFLDLCMNSVNLNASKIFAITTDTTGNMNSFGRKLERRGMNHVYCTDHLLQLTCKLCYSNVTDTFGECFASSVEKARNMVTFFNKSTQATAKLKQKQLVLDSCEGTPKGVNTDVVTR